MCVIEKVRRSCKVRVKSICVNYLNLLPVASGDVGYSPADFLAYRLFQVGAEEVQQTWQDAAAENQLGLNVVARYYVADCPQRRRHDTRRLMPANS